MLLTSIFLVLRACFDGQIREGLGALMLVPLFFGSGFMGALISLGIIYTGVNLKKMKASALTQAWGLTVSGILVGFSLVATQSPIISLIGALIIGASLINGIYLYRLHHYFK